MDKIWKQDAIVDEETRDMVPNQVVIAASAINLRGETMSIAANFTARSSSYDD